MNDLIALILEKKYDECNQLFKEYMEAIREAKILEAKKAIAAKMSCGTIEENKNYDKLDPKDQEIRRTKLSNRIIDQMLTKQKEYSALEPEYHSNFMRVLQAQRDKTTNPNAEKRYKAALVKKSKNVQRQKQLSDRLSTVRGVMRKSTYMTGKTNPKT